MIDRPVTPDVHDWLHGKLGDHFDKGTIEMLLPLEGSGNSDECGLVSNNIGRPIIVKPLVSGNPSECLYNAFALIEVLI